MKTHLLDSSEPITEGRTQVAICGATVKDAAFVKQSEDTFAWTVTDNVNFGGLCFRCRRKMWEQKGKYWYGITDGQNAKSGEREAAV